MKRCLKCNSEINRMSKYCPECGEKCKELTVNTAEDDTMLMKGLKGVVKGVLIVFSFDK